MTMTERLSMFDHVDSLAQEAKDAGIIFNRAIRAVWLPGLSVPGDGVYAFCGHRWNLYGYLAGDMVRWPHCSDCSGAGFSHAVGTVDALRSDWAALRRGYKGNGDDRWRSDPKWRQRQIDFAQGAWRARR